MSAWIVGTETNMYVQNERGQNIAGPFTSWHAARKWIIHNGYTLRA